MQDRYLLSKTLRIQFPSDFLLNFFQYRMNLFYYPIPYDFLVLVFSLLLNRYDIRQID